MKKRFEALDGMRGVAAMAVVAYHTGVAVDLPSYLIVHGDIAVDFFFALSGFVLMHANGRALASEQLSGGKFIAMRVARLWPMVILGAALAATSYAIRDEAPRGGSATIVAGFFALPGIVGMSTTFSNQVYWSLLGEILANSVFVAFSKLKWTMMAIAHLAIFATFSWLSIAHGTIHFGFIGLDDFGPTMARVLASFNAGVLTWFIWDQYKTYVPEINPLWLAPILLFPLLAPMGNTTFRLTVQLSYIGIVFPIILVLGANAKTMFSSVSTRLGDLSYPLYAIHLPLIPLVVAWAKPDGIFQNLLLEALIPISLALLVLPVDRFIDRPARAFLRALLVARASSPIEQRA